jgi:hypothetical protein
MTKKDRKALVAAFRKEARREEEKTRLEQLAARVRELEDLPAHLAAALARRARTWTEKH